VLDTGETLRWVVEIDGKDVPDVDARVERHPERSGVMVMTFVRGDEELEIESWSTKRYSHGPAVIRTLGDLRRRSGTYVDQAERWKRETPAQSRDADERT
jgi:hypothetical protein